MATIESKHAYTGLCSLSLLLLALSTSIGATCGDPEVEPTRAIADDSPEAESRRGIMDDVVAALQVALPPSLDGARFSDPANRAMILAALQSLASSSEELDEHGVHGEASFAFLSHSLARDTRDIERRFEAGRTDEARFLLLHTTELCVACHARLPDADEHPLGQELMTAEALAELPPGERAQFEMATRHFDAAAASFEEILVDASVLPADLDIEGLVDTYLELCLRVLDDPKRADRSLSRLLKRDDLPAHLRENAEAWVASLGDLQDYEPTDSPVIEARRLIAGSQDPSRFRDDRQALVPLVFASGLLHRFLESQRKSSPEVGEAYYLLGVVEASVGRSFWASQTEHLLETSIRIGPGEAYARSAFALLEEFVIAGYTGSAGTNVPPEEQRRLEELRDLMEDAPAP